MAAGEYVAKIQTATGFAKITGSLTKDWTVSPTITTSIQASFAGGKELTIDGEGFIQEVDGIQNNDIRVCGLRATPTSVSANSITVEVPALVNSATQALYSLAKSQVVAGDYSSDGNAASPVTNTFDD